MNSKIIMPDIALCFIKEVLKKVGCIEAHACRWAELLIETSLLGIDTHGIRMLDRYMNFVLGGGINPTAEPVIILDNGSCASINGKSSFGHLAADMATDVAIEKAIEYGISCVTVNNCNHVGACGLYALKVSSKDCIGICSTVSRPGMAPWGGKKAILGINPIAISAPVEGKHNFLIDISTTITSMGRITKAADIGQSIPNNWALDVDGNLTTDPNQAINGSLLPIGDHKGYGLSMAIEILTALLSGGKLSPEIRSWINQTEKPMEASFMIIVINIANFQNPKAFKTRIKEWLDLINGLPLRDGFDRIYYPGEIEGEKYNERKKNGIPIEKRTEKMFKQLADYFKIEKPEIKDV